MPFLITIITGGLTQVPIFPTRWLVTAMITIVWSQSLGCADPSGRGIAVRLGAAGTAIVTILIPSTLLVISARSLGFGGLGAIKKHGLCLVKAERKRALVPGVILGRFQDKAMTLGAASIPLADPESKVQGSLDFSRDSFPNGLVLDIFLTIFLLGLDMDGWP